jgi:hypothetical protein
MIVPSRRSTVYDKSEPSVEAGACVGAASLDPVCRPSALRGPWDCASGVNAEPGPKGPTPAKVAGLFMH